MDKKLTDPQDIRKLLQQVSHGIQRVDGEKYLCPSFSPASGIVHQIYTMCDMRGLHQHIRNPANRGNCGLCDGVDDWGEKVRYLSVCSGIEAATAAWDSLGWEAVAYSEIEPFPRKVLKHHYPDVPNLGDMTKFKEWPDYANVDVLVGGTPCQSFSIAGLRKGIDDPRGKLMLTYLAISDKYRPKYVVWENVPGVLSSNGGKDFGTFLSGLGELGYGFAYRVLDAQYCRTHEYLGAVHQRRKRVFVVGCLGDWRRAAAVLFDSESLRGNPPPSRKTREEVAGTIGARTGRSIGVQDATSGHMIPVYALASNTIGRQPENGGNGTGYDETGSNYTLTKTDVHAVAFQSKDSGSDAVIEHSPTICNQHRGVAIAQQMQVRRLTPRECERLQGFKDDYTNIPGASDTTRYKSLGNSMAVNVMQIIGQRIQMASEILQMEIAA